ncbi:hypothetical protein OJF2_65150 [Aquisphaera giovannonii]|uniref:Uncharacterized protein n=1 Tax=Aquisphaera giovannonii TaxID=406548 RepID=A0A5B9WDF9_9BACT|nr:hypothetical protein [Aquisphaera giovannonii]QEH37920.1 hypothetical protein OJF2_65150 [Aquisphaera giovannonii]
MTLEFMFRNLLSTPAFAPALGDVELERSDLPKLPITRNYNSLLAAAKSAAISLEDYIPRDEKRRQASDFFADIATHFLHYHELRHILAGHLDYEDNDRGVAYIAEYRGGDATTQPSIVSQVLEWDADRSAMLMLTRSIFAIRIRSMVAETMSGQVGPYSDLFRDRDSLAVKCLIAASALLRLFDFDILPASEWAEQYYPPPQVRRISLSNVVVEWVQNNCGVPLAPTMMDDIRDTIHSGTSEVVEHTFRELWDVKYNNEFRFLVARDESREYLARLQGMFENMRQELSKYSYVAL